MRKYLLILVFTVNCLNAFSQDFKTLTYFTNDSLRLDLDLFLPKDSLQKKVPLFIFIHGGGFSSGDRNNGHPVCRYLREKGYAAASISYTLYMKGRDFTCTGKISDKFKALQLAANQLWQSTLYFIKNQEEYNIDTAKIFIGGNSAGGTTVLHAAFWNNDSMSIYQEKFPESFRYAGVISGSGALMDTSLINKKTLIPAMLFHGTCDDLVPYATAPHHYCPKGSPGWMMLYGSYTLFNRIIALGGKCYLVTFCGATHEYHDRLFLTDQQKIAGFIDKVLKGEKIQEHEVIKVANKCKRTFEYRFCD